MDLSKRITPEFAIEIGDTFTTLNPHDGRAANGFGNLELGGKYQLLKNGEHEAIVSIGLGVEVGGTGGRSVGADSFSTWAPGIFFGKGFGDLPRGRAVLEAVCHYRTARCCDSHEREHSQCYDRRPDRRTRY